MHGRQMVPRREKDVGPERTGGDGPPGLEHRAVGEQEGGHELVRDRGRVDGRPRSLREAPGIVGMPVRNEDAVGGDRRKSRPQQFSPKSQRSRYSAASIMNAE